MQILINNLRRLRLNKGYTQERLAEELGISAQTVSRWECGNTLPDVLFLPRLAQIYGITIDDLYREPANAYPNYAQRLLAVYEASGRSEDFLAAEVEFKRLLAQDPTADDLRAFGVLYHYMMKYCAANAQHYLDEAIEKADRHNWVYASAANQKTVLMCDLGRGNEEAAHYEKELRENPGNTMAWNLCIGAHHYAGNQSRAYALVMEALENFPDNPVLWGYAGDICRALGRYDEAFIHWQRVQELDDSFLDPAYAMGLCYEQMGRYSQALAAWQDLHRILLRRGLTQESQFTAERIKFCESNL